jgi:ABC-2 type transport system ATP-binding protein
LMSAGKIIALGTPSELKTQWMTESVIELECSDLLEALEVLESEDTLTEVAVFGNLLHIVAAEPDVAVAAIKERLAHTGVSVIRADLISPSLEDVFVTLTSRDNTDTDTP